MYFVPLGQRSASAKIPFEKDFMMYAGAIVVETSRPMDDMQTLARKTLAEINPNYTVVVFQTFDGADCSSVYAGTDAGDC